MHPGGRISEISRVFCTCSRSTSVAIYRWRRRAQPSGGHCGERGGSGVAHRRGRARRPRRRWRRLPQARGGGGRRGEARRGSTYPLPLPPPPPRARRGLVRRGGCGLRSEGAPESRDPPLETPPRCVTITAQSRFRVHVATCSPSRCSLLAASDPLSRSLSGGVSPCSNLTEDLRGWNLKVKLVMCLLFTRGSSTTQH